MMRRVQCHDLSACYQESVIDVEALVSAVAGLRKDPAKQENPGLEPTLDDINSALEVWMLTLWMLTL